MNKILYIFNLYVRLKIEKLCGAESPAFYISSKMKEKVLFNFGPTIL